MPGFFGTTGPTKDTSGYTGDTDPNNFLAGLVAGIPTNLAGTPADLIQGMIQKGLENTQPADQVAADPLQQMPGTSSWLQHQVSGARADTPNYQAGAQISSLMSPQGDVGVANNALVGALKKAAVFTALPKEMTPWKDAPEALRAAIRANPTGPEANEFYTMSGGLMYNPQISTVNKDVLMREQAARVTPNKSEMAQLLALGKNTGKLSDMFDISDWTDRAPWLKDTKLELTLGAQTGKPDPITGVVPLDPMSGAYYTGQNKISLNIPYATDISGYLPQLMAHEMQHAVDAKIGVRGANAENIKEQLMHAGAVPGNALSPVSEEMYTNNFGERGAQATARRLYLSPEELLNSPLPGAYLQSDRFTGAPQLQSHNDFWYSGDGYKAADTGNFLRLAQSLAKKLPPDVLNPPYKGPVSAGNVSKALGQSVSEADQDLLREHAFSPANMLDAQRHLTDGHRVFIQHEMEEEPTEINNVSDLHGYTPDQIHILPKGM
jgi:hypothetical protein